MAQRHEAEVVRVERSPVGDARCDAAAPRRAGVGPGVVGHWITPRWGGGVARQELVAPATAYVGEDVQSAVLAPYEQNAGAAGRPRPLLACFSGSPAGARPAALEEVPAFPGQYGRLDVRGGGQARLEPRGRRYRPQHPEGGGPPVGSSGEDASENPRDRHRRKLRAWASRQTTWCSPGSPPTTRSRRGVRHPLLAARLRPGPSARWRPRHRRGRRPGSAPAGLAPCRGRSTRGGSACHVVLSIVGAIWRSHAADARDGPGRAGLARAMMAFGLATEGTCSRAAEQGEVHVRSCTPSATCRTSSDEPSSSPLRRLGLGSVRLGLGGIGLGLGRRARSRRAWLAARRRLRRRLCLGGRSRSRAGFRLCVRGQIPVGLDLQRRDTAWRAEERRLRRGLRHVGQGRGAHDRCRCGRRLSRNRLRLPRSRGERRHRAFGGRRRRCPRRSGPAGRLRRRHRAWLRPSHSQLPTSRPAALAAGARRRSQRPKARWCWLRRDRRRLRGRWWRGLRGRLGSDGSDLGRVQACRPQGSEQTEVLLGRSRRRSSRLWPSPRSQPDRSQLDRSRPDRSCAPRSWPPRSWRPRSALASGGAPLTAAGMNLAMIRFTAVGWVMIAAPTPVPTQAKAAIAITQGDTDRRLLARRAARVA